MVRNVKSLIKLPIPPVPSHPSFPSLMQPAAESDNDPTSPQLYRYAAPLPVPPFLSPSSVLWKLLSSLPPEVREDVAALAIDGTSATTLLVHGGSGRALLPAKLYNEAQGSEALAAVKVRRGGGKGAA